MKRGNESCRYLWGELSRQGKAVRKEFRWEHCWHMEEQYGGPEQLAWSGQGRKN